MALSGETAKITSTGIPQPPNTSFNGIPPCSSSTVTKTIASPCQRAWASSTSFRNGEFPVGF